MSKIDRISVTDARRVMEKFVPNERTRNILIDFLSSAIVYAHKLRPENWNVNLDKGGKFVRFNVGQEYCIEINDERILVLCMRDDLKNMFTSPASGVKFRGHHRNEIVDDKNLSSVPDCLKLTKGSVGCLIERDKIEEYLPSLKQTNLNFISKAQRTCLLSVSEKAHSPGYIKYLSEIRGEDIPNPSYVNISD